MKSEKGGLSPLVRGKRDICAITSVSCGSIPACAGETAIWRARLCDGRVYPRLCGGNYSSLFIYFFRLGLSPLVRGKQILIVSRQIRIGSIPACAGETWGVPSIFSRLGVYPRLCGGNRLLSELDMPMLGLSPLVRGKLEAVGIGGSRRGSIPACAGETRLVNIHTRSVGVYPRLCGGNMAS